MNEKATAPTLTNWINVPIPCARCASPVKVRCSKSFSRIAAILCTKCGWRLELEPIRASAKAQQTQPEDTDPDPPGEIDPPD